MSCRRQLCRLLRGSLFTDVDGFSNSSNREAGTGQSGIFTGVTGLEGFPSFFSSIRCCSRKQIIQSTTSINYIMIRFLLRNIRCLTFLRRFCLRSSLSCWFCSRTVFMLFLSSLTLTCNMNLSFLVLVSSSCTDSSSTLMF